MPLVPPEKKRVEILRVGGLDLEEGRLVRAAGSWRRLENFDLLTPGAIRKVRGYSFYSPNSAGRRYLALRDYRRKPTEDEVVVAYADDGTLSAIRPGGLTLLADLLGPSDIPYMTVLPILTGEEFGLGLPNERRQFLILTMGPDKRPVKVDIDTATDTALVTLLGIESPQERWTTPTQHSLMVGRPIPAGELPIPVLPTAEEAMRGWGLGISLPLPRRYRWSWWNPMTRRDSSLAPFHDDSVELDYDGLLVNRSPLGAAYDPDRRIVEIPLRWDGEPPEPASGPVGALLVPTAPPAGSGYTHIRVWATHTGGADYFLVPRLYQEDGTLITDGDGAIWLGLASTLPLTGRDLEGDPDDEGLFVFDGIASKGYGWEVDGGAQAGTTINVKVAASGAMVPAFADGFLGVGFNHGDRFRIAGDDTLYRIMSYTDPVLFIWTIEPALAVSPPDGATIEFLRVAPVNDEELVEGWLGEGGSDPAPPSVWGAVYQSRLWLIPADDPTKVIYSETDNYEAFPPTNFFRFLSDDLDEITALVTARQVGLVTEGHDQRLVVGKPRSTAQITGTSPANFERMPWHPATGIVGRRAVCMAQGSLFALTQQGLEVLEESRPIYIAAKIRTLLAGAIGEGLTRPFMIQDTVRGLVLLAIRLADGDGDSDTFLAIDTTLLPTIGEGGSPYSLIPGPRAFPDDGGGPVEFVVAYESNVGGVTQVLVAGINGYIYRLFDGGSSDGEDTPLVAIAETQELPQDDKEKRKIFRRLLLDQEQTETDPWLPLDYWTVEFSVDGGQTFYPPRNLYSETFIGLVGKTLIVRLSHGEMWEEGMPDPTMYNYTIEYNVIGEGR